MAVPDDSDDLLASAARMYYLDQFDQRDIGALLGVSRSTVSRLLKSARERSIVQISVSPYDPRDRPCEAELRDRLVARHAVVIRTTGRPTAQVGPTVGYFAAPAVSEMIGTGAIIGVAGGRTLAALVRHVPPVQIAQNATVVQLMGNIGPKPAAIDGLEISHELARLPGNRDLARVRGRLHPAQDQYQGDRGRGARGRPARDRLAWGHPAGAPAAAGLGRREHHL